MASGPMFPIPTGQHNLKIETQLVQTRLNETSVSALQILNSILFAWTATETRSPA